MDVLLDVNNQRKRERNRKGQFSVGPLSFSFDCLSYVSLCFTLFVNALGRITSCSCTSELLCWAILSMICELILLFSH